MRVMLVVMAIAFATALFTSHSDEVLTPNQNDSKRIGEVLASSPVNISAIENNTMSLNETLALPPPPLPQDDNESQRNITDAPVLPLNSTSNVTATAGSDNSPPTAIAQVESTGVRVSLISPTEIKLKNPVPAASLHAPALKVPQPVVNAVLGTNVTSSIMENAQSTESVLNPPATHAPPLATTSSAPAPLPFKKDMLIAVVTSPNHFAARRAIRRSYALAAKDSSRVDVKFFVGQLPADFENRDLVDREITHEEDMIRLTDFTESYHNLSYKALDIFKFAADHGYRSVFKVDDDTYVRVPLALHFYDNHLGDPLLYAGDFVNGEKAMVDDPNSKWYMKDQYPFDRLEDYANGPGVLLGEQALRHFQKHFDTIFRYRVDDAAIAIWLKDLPMNKVKMPVDSYSYYVHPDTVWVNPVNSEEMEKIHVGQLESLQVCHETCLCWGGEMPKGDCLTWGQFMSAGYRDLIPRLVQTAVERIDRVESDVQMENKV